ncbi:hypothetical protein [Anaerorudis cellulosivorans]|uniref:hypothetical protein n=1 Tax=Anaerorudis cellulosivorans TaxID=3397862 RepID=UPI00221EC855|nr:hypothetical protein [Seramator thermalis]MCW1735713.1 hypothetical protein [Seramator thermalis]
MKTKIRLEDINKTDPFKVPDHYFEQFNKEIMKRLPPIKTPEFQPVPLREKVRPWIYMAAMFVGLFIIIQFLTKNAGNQSTRSSATYDSGMQSATIPSDKYWSTVEISEEEFYQYLEDQLSEDEYYDYIYNEFYATQDM